ncbi:beta strand repeat-containing protein [Terracidiphilus gabretensis]|uniref:beta strand repeat-containing protein n=1 Tax=Terracidiphilus gabretensis TaxID=1577687 RepID=UPI0009E89D54|nr:choice-of-anchor tandem repeat GloVer-containing protein [Terracidiphilus gabretensis]
MPNPSLVSSASLLLPDAVASGPRLGCLLLAVVFCLFGACRAQAQSATESVVYSFAGATDSESPAASLIQAGNGNFYGTTLGNLYPDYGSIFQVTPSGTFTTIYNFGGITDSATPFAPLYQGADGNLYGTTFGNLIFGTDGSVFYITPAGTLTTVYSFTGGSDGDGPASGLVQLGDGSFDGTTLSGGSNNGTIFNVGVSTPESILVSFNTYNGSSPSSAPVEGSDGNLYGVTSSGGENGHGAIYQLTPTGTINTIYSFTGSADGSNPAGPLVEGPDGSFYGATGSAGAQGAGTIFKVTSAGVLTTLYSLNGTTDGGSPVALFLGGDGMLYGNSTTGGANRKGTFFRATNAGVFAALYSFTSTDATAPQGGVVEGSDGSFWGTGSAGGANNYGGVYKVALSPAPPAPVTLTASTASFDLGDPVTLSWSVNNAFSTTMQRCNATITPAPISAAGWSGPQTSTFNSTTGLLTGSVTITPTYPGTYTYGLTCGGSESGTTTIVIGGAAALTIITPSTLPTAYVNVPYSQTIAVSGGVQPYTFSVSTGSLPAGLSLNATTGVISGTPAATGISTFTIKVTDSNASGAATTTANFDLTVVQKLALTNTALPDGRIGTAYSQQLDATGGTPPYTFSVAKNSTMPAGLSLSASGLVSGTPTVAAANTFAVIVTDSASQSITANVTLTIDPLLSSSGILTLNPNSISVGGTTVATLSITTPPGSPAMTGTVQFTANGIALGSPVALTNGVATLTTPAFNSSGTVVIAAFYSGDPNFLALGYPAQDLTVSVTAQPAISISPGSASVATGSSAMLTALLYNFASGTQVTLACGQLPTDVTCSFQNVINTSATIVINTSNTTTSSLQNNGTDPARSGTRALAALPALALLGLLGLRRRNLFARLLMILAVAAAAFAAQGCGNSTKTTNQAGTGTTAITVTATAGTQTASAQFILTVHN